MNAILLNTFAAGFFYLAAGICGLVRHFLLEPKLLAEPRTPRWLLRVFFGFSCVMIYVGLRFLTAWATGAATVTPPGATAIGVLVAVTIFTYKGSLLYDTVTRKASFTLDELIKRFKDL